MFKLDLEKAEEPEFKLQTSTGSSKKQESSRKTYTSALLTMPKLLTVWITTNCGKFWKRLGIPDHLTYLLRNLYAGQEWTLRTGHEKTGSKLGKEYVKAVYCHPAYLTICSVHHENSWAGWSTNCNQDCRENINNLRYTDDTAPMAESEE